MKKITLSVILVALLATSCEFKSKKKPIAGTDLVTFTVEDSDKVGVAEVGEFGDIILPARFFSVEAYGGVLWGKAEESSDFEILSFNGKQIIPSVKIVETGNNYRIIQKENLLKRYISEGYFSAYYDELLVAQSHGYNYIFYRNTSYAETWGIAADDVRRFDKQIFTPNYDKILIFSSNGGKDVTVVGHEVKSWHNGKWHASVRTDGDSFSGYKTISDGEFEALLQNAGALKWSKENGALAVYEK